MVSVEGWSVEDIAGALFSSIIFSNVRIQRKIEFISKPRCIACSKFLRWGIFLSRYWIEFWVNPLNGGSDWLIPRFLIFVQKLHTYTSSIESSQPQVSFHGAGFTCVQLNLNNKMAGWYSFWSCCFSFKSSLVSSFLQLWRLSKWIYLLIWLCLC